MAGDPNDVRGGGRRKRVSLPLDRRLGAFGAATRLGVDALNIVGIDHTDAHTIITYIEEEGSEPRQARP